MVEDTLEDYEAGSDDYYWGLQDALNKLTDYENQVSSQMISHREGEEPRIMDPEATLLRNSIDMMRMIIDSLIAN